MLERLYIQGAAAYGPVSNLGKTSILSVSKMRHFLHSKPSYTLFTLPTQKLKQLKAFASFEIETCCMDLAYVDKLAKNKNGVKCLLVRPDLFDKTIEAKRMKTKDYKETVCVILTIITKKIDPKNFAKMMEQMLLEGLEEYAKLKGNKSTLH